MNYELLQEDAWSSQPNTLSKPTDWIASGGSKLWERMDGIYVWAHDKVVGTNETTQVVADMTKSEVDKVKQETQTTNQTKQDLKQTKSNIESDHLDHGDKNIDQMLARTPQLKAFLNSSGINATERLNQSVNVFSQYARSYLELDNAQSNTMWHGIVAAMIDSLVFQINKDNVTTQSADKTSDTSTSPQSSEWLFDKWLGAWSKIAGIFGWWDTSFGQLKSAFAPLQDVFAYFGWGDILRTRVKAIWLQVELMRKAKQLFVEAGKPLESTNWLTWNQSILYNPQQFVWSVRVIEQAIKADPNLIRPEYMKTEDFVKIIQIKDNQTWTTQQFNFLQLLWLEQPQTWPNPLVVAQAFQDITPESVWSNPSKVAGELMNAIGVVNNTLQSGISSRWNRDREWKSMFGGKTQELMNVFAEFSDPKDPNSLYSTVMKWLNMVWWFFTGKSFFNDSYDRNAQSKLKKYTRNLDDPQNQVRESDQNQELLFTMDHRTDEQKKVTVWALKQRIFAKESLSPTIADPYVALNPNSTAVGKYQFLLTDDSTVAGWFPKLKQYITDHQIPVMQSSNPLYVPLLASLNNHDKFKSRSKNDQELIITYMSNHDLQEDFMNQVITTDYQSWVTKLIGEQKSTIVSSNLDATQLMMSYHFLWPNNLVKALTQGRDTLSDEIKKDNLTLAQYVA